MSSTTDLIEQQKAWAFTQGLEPDDRGYLSDVASNLFQPMSSDTKYSFERGSGSELVDKRTGPAKMKALHSSSALAVNFFDIWASNDATALQKALALDGEITKIAFEAQYPTGLGRWPPNLDVALMLSGGMTIAIESKFTEWLSAKSPRKAPFKPKYFPPSVGLWAERGLPQSQELANRMNARVLSFRYLDVPQLLKHALGLSNQLGNKFCLYYTYLEMPFKESTAHSEEVRQFSELVGEELRFKVVTYQQLWRALSAEAGVDSEYLSYLDARYCRLLTS